MYTYILCQINQNKHHPLKSTSTSPKNGVLIRNLTIIFL